MAGGRESADRKDESSGDHRVQPPAPAGSSRSSPSNHQLGKTNSSGVESKVWINQVWAISVLFEINLLPENPRAPNSVGLLFLPQAAHLQPMNTHTITNTNEFCSLLVPLCTQCWAQPHTQPWAPPKLLSSAGGIAWTFLQIPCAHLLPADPFPLPSSRAQPGRSSSSFSSCKTKLLLTKLLQQNCQRMLKKSEFMGREISGVLKYQSRNSGSQTHNREKKGGGSKKWEN